MVFKTPISISLIFLFERRKSSPLIICPPQQPDNHGSATWALCPLQAGQRSSHHPLVCLPPASVLPASFPVAIMACHVSAGSCCSALSFNKSSYVLWGKVEGTDNSNHRYSPSKGYLAFTGALTDCSLTWSWGQMPSLWWEEVSLWRRKSDSFIQTTFFFRKVWMSRERE